MGKEELHKFVLAKQIFKEQFYTNDAIGEPIMCGLNDVFDSANEDSDNHNCLGCNFANMTSLIEQFFERIKSYELLEDIAFDFILRLYLMVERVNTVCKMIELPDSKKRELFPTFTLINKWANFIKHPKAFMLTHHAEFFLAEDSDKKDSIFIDEEEFIIIDDAFVNKYYSGHNKNSTLREKIANKNNVCVIFPDPKLLIIDFSKEIKQFISMIQSTSEYIEILSDEATLHDYFDNLDGEL